MEKERVKFVLNHLNKLESTIMDYNSLIRPFILDYNILNNINQFNTEFLSLVQKAKAMLSAADLTEEQLKTNLIKEIQMHPPEAGFWTGLFPFAVNSTPEYVQVNFVGPGPTIEAEPSQTSSEPQEDESGDGVDQTPKEDTSSKIDGNNEV